MNILIKYDSWPVIIWRLFFFFLFFSKFHTYQFRNTNENG